NAVEQPLRQGQQFVGGGIAHADDCTGLPGKASRERKRPEFFSLRSLTLPARLLGAYSNSSRALPRHNSCCISNSQGRIWFSAGKTMAGMSSKPNAEIIRLG